MGWGYKLSIYGSIIGSLALILALVPYIFQPNLIITDLESIETIGNNNETHITFDITNNGLKRANIANSKMRYGMDSYSYPFLNYTLNGKNYIEVGETAHYVLALDLSIIQINEFFLRLQINYDDNRNVEGVIKIIR